MKKQISLLIMFSLLLTGCKEVEQVKYIAHRGATYQGAVENSQEAFILAGQDGFDGVETDVQITKDNVLVCSHDNNLERLTKLSDNPRSDKISDLTYSQLKDVELCNQTNKARICTLERYLDICKEYDLKPVVELKPTKGIYYYDGAHKANYKNIPLVLDMIYEKNLEKDAIIISFMRGCLQYIRENDKHIKMQWLCSDNVYDYLGWAKQYNIGIDINYGFINKEIIDSVHEFHQVVNMWTYNDKNKLNNYLDLGVDFITTDIKLMN